MGWGSGGLKSCDSLLARIDCNDPTLKDLVVLPMKDFGSAELENLSLLLESGKNTNLITLAASGHSVSTSSLGRLGSAIASGKSNLCKLAIGNQWMGDQGVMAFCNPLEAVHGRKLEGLDFAWKNISREGMVALGKTFGHSKNLRQLILSRNEKIGNEGVQAFNEAISETNDTILESLEILDLASCEIGANGVEALSKLLTRCSIKSISLTLTSNPLTSHSCAALSTILCGASKVTSLYLAHCDIGDTGLKLLMASQPSTNQKDLHVLDLSYNGIGPAGAAKLASALWENGKSGFKNLKELVLTGNALGYVGVQCLGNALAHRNEEGFFEIGNETVEVLDLTQTNCGKEGAVSILRCSKLKRVRLFNNQLADDGFAALAIELMGGHTSIEQLDIGGNNAKTSAVIQVLDAVGTIHTGIDSKLNTLEIGGNETGLNVEEAIQRVKVTRPELDVARDKPRPQQEAQGDLP